MKLVNPLTMISWRRLIKGTVVSSYKNECANAAAAMAFDFVFAIFPGILILTILIAVFDIPLDAFSGLITGLEILLPSPMVQVVSENVNHLGQSSKGFFVLGLIGVIWPASASMSTTMSALNRAYGVVEKRGFWFRRVLSIGLVVSLGVALVILFNLIAFSEQVESWLNTNWTLSEEIPSLPGLVRRVATVAGTMFVAACIYRIAPNVRQTWLNVIPGSVLFLLLWTLIAGSFGYFVAKFSYYNFVFGLLGSVIGLLLSSYLAALILLLGGELNGNMFKLHQVHSGRKNHEHK